MDKKDSDHVKQLSCVDARGDEEVLTWTEEEEKAVRRKIDLRTVPIVALLYLLCFLDRTNIGNARIIGMEKELKLGGYKFNWSLTIFYILYMLVEVPSNVVLKRVGARFWLPFLVAGFGVVSMATAFVVDFEGLMVARAFLGAAEGGTLPGISFYLSKFYRRSELLFRIGIFMSAVSTAGAFGGLLASGLSQIPAWGAAGVKIHTWRNIFFFEGLVTMLVGMAAPFIMPEGPGSCKFLNERETKIATERVLRENQADHDEKVNMKHIKMASFNILNFLCALMFSFTNITVSSISLFMPTILNQMGYSNIQAQLYSAPPYVAAAVCAIAVAFVSDKTRRRGLYLSLFAAISVIGFVILRANPASLNVRYMAIFFVSIGAFPSGPGILSWALNNSAGPAVQAVTTAYVTSIGTLGAIVATWTYLPQDKPDYPIGHSINLAAQATVATLGVLGILFCLRENKVRIAGKRDDRLIGLSEKDKIALGYRHPDFRYIP